jgi:hypothetical protein
MVAFHVTKAAVFGSVLVWLAALLPRLRRPPPPPPAEAERNEPCRVVSEIEASRAHGDLFNSW